MFRALFPHRAPAGCGGVRGSAILSFALALLAGCPALAQSGASLPALRHRFLDPPDSSRIMVRWWWFGPAAAKPELTRELEQMKAAGIGGVEIANLYPLELDNPSTGFHNTPFLSREHLDDLRFAVEEARRLGLRVDVTLGSGWPLGGPHIPVTQAAGWLRVEKLPVAPGASSATAPFADAGEEIVSAFLLPASATAEDAAGSEPLAAPVSGRYSFPAATQPRKLICFIASRTGMMVKRPSL
ncbi:MAG TPA: glycosyl hydrolase, partial [Candidatus Sulfopaludibacter sp.]|nr:glycosyl hydrolase [Candidatus Sulfopaludibacter sp.]